MPFLSFSHLKLPSVSVPPLRFIKNFSGTEKSRDDKKLIDGEKKVKAKDDWLPTKNDYINFKDFLLSYHDDNDGSSLFKVTTIPVSSQQIIFFVLFLYHGCYIRDESLWFGGLCSYEVKVVLIQQKFSFLRGYVSQS